jgi:hypothetical protein
MQDALGAGPARHVTHVDLEPIRIVKVWVLCHEVALGPSTEVEVSSTNYFEDDCPPVAEHFVDIFFFNPLHYRVVVVIDVAK